MQSAVSPKNRDASDDNDQQARSSGSRSFMSAQGTSSDLLPMRDSFSEFSPPVQLVSSSSNLANTAGGQHGSKGWFWWWSVIYSSGRNICLVLRTYQHYDPYKLNIQTAYMPTTHSSANYNTAHTGLTTEKQRRLETSVST